MTGSEAVPALCRPDCGLVNDDGRDKPSQTKQPRLNRPDTRCGGFISGSSGLIRRLPGGLSRQRAGDPMPMPNVSQGLCAARSNISESQRAASPTKLVALQSAGPPTPPCSRVLAPGLSLSLLPWLDVNHALCLMPGTRCCRIILASPVSGWLLKPEQKLIEL